MNYQTSYTFLSLGAAIHTLTVGNWVSGHATPLPGISQHPLLQPGERQHRSGGVHKFHSLEDLSALAQQRLQVGIAQGPVEAVPISFGLSD